MSYMPFKQTAFAVWKGSSGHHQGWSKAFDPVGDSMTLFPPPGIFFCARPSNLADVGILRSGAGGERRSDWPVHVMAIATIVT